MKWNAPLLARAVLLLLSIEATVTPALAQEKENDNPSYPIRIDPQQVYECPELKIQFQHLTIAAKHVTVVPITCKLGMTGAVLLGDGEFQFKPEEGRLISGGFRGIMLRFNPGEQEQILPLATAKKVNDRAAAEMSRHLLSVVFRHCWHSGKDALIPPKGTLAGVFYAKEFGDLLISDSANSPIAYNFTANKALYEKQ